MGIERDTFLGFIDDLAADLDDHESSAEERASRHFLSRSHFDRLISATAGEPPVSFRRRILLERAAFRLATSNEGVLQLAVEAGYSSNEAFTVRSAGRTAWRRAAGGHSPARSRSRHPTTSISTRRAASACPGTARRRP
jgi:AraC family transcriptional regulator